MSNLKIGVFADKYIGKKTLEFLFDNYAEDVQCVCITEKDSEVGNFLVEKCVPENLILTNSDILNKKGKEKLVKLELDYIILAWWPYIISQSLIDIPKKGVLNFHPSYLPYNRGKNYNFWNIVEGCPYGVSIHFVDKDIDSGDIVFQKKILTNWEDNGGTLYDKAQEAMIELFKESYPKIIQENYIVRKQDKEKGSFHYGYEMEKKVHIDLDKKYIARDLLNLLRAKTFSPYPGCYFEDQGKKYEVFIKIKESKNEI